ncbi:uncharacterized protein Hap1MRO34_003083 [Clarias gariepinus]|uniref:uncharacterized protein LOC128517187 n=1 Tax=Clarias gariepinus TaxID=13013 RepID=UPI00234D2DE3|nr:uncharacterized protein LOC128517187 [Clarias gariepinus]
MAEDARTIRVSGLPENISESRLIDKLQIHFLRKRNDGGEIRSVTISKTAPGTAFITFEEGGVALRLAQREKQTFKVNEKIYDISISLHQEGVNKVDKVLLSLSVLVDYRTLPGGKNSLRSFHKSFPGVRLSFDDEKERCTLKGRYSEVQLLTNLLLESLDQLESQDLSSGDKPSPKTESKRISPNSPLGASEDPGVEEHTRLRDVPYLDLESDRGKTGFPLSGSYDDHASGAALSEDKWVSPPDISAELEDFSLIVDSDIFQYIHKFCSREYQSILRRHKVEVLDVNCDDITTLYLEPKAALSEHDMSSVLKAHQDLAHLYQQKESQLRREHVYKQGIPEKELTNALESLRTRLPKLMINEKDRNVYMVGSVSDVSEAKQFLNDVRGLGVEKKIQSDHPFVPSQSKSTLSKHESLAWSGPSGLFSTSLQNPDDLFMPKRDRQDAQLQNFSERRQNSVELKSLKDHLLTGQFNFSSQRLERSTEDIFSPRRNDFSQESHVPSDLDGMDHGGLVDKNKCTDSLFESSKPSSPLSILNANEKFFNTSDSKVAGSETQITLSKGSKTKQPEAARERKMAANLGLEMYRSSNNLPTAPILDKVADVKERMFPDSGQPRSLPLISTSLNSNLDPNSLLGISSAITSTSKMNLQDRKPALTPACLSGDQDAKSLPIMPSGSTLTSSNSQSSQTREIVAIDIALPFKLWLYLMAVYRTEIDHLTSDLQVKEKVDKDDVTLCLRGVDSEKVSECHQGLKGLFAAAEKDFDVRTLPLSTLGVSNCKDKILLDLCKCMREHHKMVKVLVMSNDVMILGPKPSCDEVEATMIKVFHKDGTLEKSPNQDTSHTSKASNNDLKLLGDKTTTSTKPHSIITKDTSKIPDQSVSHFSKNLPQALTNQTRDNQEQDNQSVSQKKIKNEKLEQLDRNDSTLIQGDGGSMNKKNEETLSGSVITLGDSDKNRALTSITAQSKETSTQQMSPGSSQDQGSPRVPEPKNDTLTSHASGNQNLLSCYVCKKEYSTVIQLACDFNLCPKCEKEVHNPCRTCGTSESGIKGTMSVQESTITIPGFNRDTTLKIVYDIPDGVQGKDHPCPGAPFKGNRFEAFLPRNKATEKLLPLLQKAFHKGLTFTVKAVSSNDDGGKEGQVVWGSIPHKTKTEGGTSKNGYPDSNYTKRLEEALQAAGIEE